MSLIISADFDSGNIDVIDASDATCIELAIRPDTRSAHYQWFHFKVEGLVAGQRYTFRLGNAGGASYGHAWHGYHAVVSTDHKHWSRIASSFDGQALSFSFDADQPHAWFAYFEPYSRERHTRLIDQALNRSGCQLLASGQSIEGRTIELLRKGDGAPGKRRIWIIAQQHPGEHMAEWFMEGVIEHLQAATDPALQTLLAGADLYLVPNMNPDGAFHGHLRTNAMGKDLNRAWQDSNTRETPEVHFVQQQMEKYGVDMFLDAHGDEDIPYVFTAACEGNPGYTAQQAELEALFRRTLEQITPDFQSLHGYPRSAPGQANMTLAGNSVGERYKCLSLTLEMPFKDHDNAPDPLTGWSGQRSKNLGRDVLIALSHMVQLLR